MKINNYINELERKINHSIYMLEFEQSNIYLSLLTDSFNVNLHTKAYLHYEISKLSNDSGWKIYALTVFHEEPDTLFTSARRTSLEYDDEGEEIQEGPWTGIWNKRTNTTLFINIDQKRVYLLNHEESRLFVDTYKSIRQVMTSESLMAGMVPLHCSSFSYGGLGIAFIGDSGAGKTTLLCASLLRTGRHGGFLGNDRALANPLNNRIVLHAWPTVLGIGPGALNHLKDFENQARPDLHNRAGGTAYWLLDQNIIENKGGAFADLKDKKTEEVWSWPHKLWLTPMEVATICNSNIESSVNLKYLVFPQLSSHLKEVTLTTVSSMEAQDIIKRNILNELPFYPNWMGLPKTSREDFETRLGLFLDQLNSVRMIKITGGSNTEEIVDVLFDYLHGHTTMHD
ncbi:hypothetical protein [Paenibacillus lautus]|uniref:hypothetical protein n=1 Tax=Paenibacillus lautus TaxID=1401 RepID=UPI000BBDFC3A|nr:hypothetical protein [Paenibacillus lautus]PCL90075.1 hypothetical protein CPZ30_26375 [Paenibacillus lautus]